MLILHLVQVIHNCRAIAGCLIGQFGVKLTYVFDTQVHVQFVRRLSLEHHSITCAPCGFSCFSTLCLVELSYFLFFSLHVLRWQMSCGSTQSQEVSFQTESVLWRRWWVSIWRCPPPSSYPFRWSHSSPRYSKHTHPRWFCLHVVVFVCAVVTGGILQEKMQMWQKRPCPVPLLKLMALSVIHLQPLRLVLLDKLMMDYMTLVDSYLNSSHYEPDELQHVSMVSHLQMSPFFFLTFALRK